MKNWQARGAPFLIEETELPFRFEGLHTWRLIGWNGSEEDIDYIALVNQVRHDQSKVAQVKEHVDRGPFLIVIVFLLIAGAVVLIISQASQISNNTRNSGIDKNALVYDTRWLCRK